jgi:hypothetical protein
MCSPRGLRRGLAGPSGEIYTVGSTAARSPPTVGLEDPVCPARRHVVTPVHPQCQLGGARERVQVSSRLSEGGDPRDVAGDDERLNRFGAFASADDFHVGYMSHHMIFEQKPIAAKDVASLGDNCFAF